MDRTCKTCGNIFKATSWNKVYCSEHCRSIGIFGPIEKPCPVCGEPTHTKRSACSKQCQVKLPRDKTVRKSPEFRKKLSESLSASYRSARGVERRKQASDRMKLSNPSHDREVVQRITETRRMNGTLHTLCLHRGGNGHLTEPQVQVAAMFPESVLELAIPTKMGGTGYAPNAYKVDIGFQDIKLAVEIDGESHNSPDARARDAKKDSILAGLGWHVLRVKNQEVMESPETVRARIQSEIDYRRTTPIRWE